MIKVGDKVRLSRWNSNRFFKVASVTEEGVRFFKSDGSISYPYHVSHDWIHEPTK